VNPRVLGGGLEGDLVAEGPELGDGSLTLAVGVAADEEVAAKIAVVAVLGEQIPGDHQDLGGPRPWPPSCLPMRRASRQNWAAR
jgi:hypothetical protein